MRIYVPMRPHLATIIKATLLFEERDWWRLDIIITGRIFTIFCPVHFLEQTPRMWDQIWAVPSPEDHRAANLAKWVCPDWLPPTTV